MPAGGAGTLGLSLAAWPAGRICPHGRRSVTDGLALVRDQRQDQENQSSVQLIVSMIARNYRERAALSSAINPQVRPRWRPWISALRDIRTPSRGLTELFRKCSPQG